MPGGSYGWPRPRPAAPALSLLLLLPLFCAGFFPAEAASPPSPSSPSSLSPLARVNERVYGGDAVEQGAYPWLGALYIRVTGHSVYDTQFCGCTLISSKHVLTAAHCVVDAEQRDLSLSVLFNSTNIDLPQEDVRRIYQGTLNFDVTRIAIHPEFDAKAEKRWADFAVLTLSNKVEGIEPITLDDTMNSNSWIGESLRFMGWGVTDFDDLNYYSTILIENDIQILSATDCMSATFTFTLNITDELIAEVTVKYRKWFICGVDFPLNGGLGGGDGGGPLFMIIPETNQPVQLGVASWFHKGTLLSGRTSAWAYVATAKDWIMARTSGASDGGDGDDGEDGLEDGEDGGYPDDGGAASSLSSFFFYSSFL
ncbi:CLIP domain-containing serine protease [Balamuthia mandrillaris]